MRNYIIGFLIVCLMVLGSFFYKTTKAPILNGFPIDQRADTDESGQPPLYLYIFFSRNNCHTCLETIEALNKLTPPLFVTGIVPGNELKNESDLRKVTGATFRLIPFSTGYKRFNPHYAPTLYGVSGKGAILFVIPGVPEQKTYIYNFLVNFYGKSIDHLIPMQKE